VVPADAYLPTNVPEDAVKQATRLLWFLADGENQQGEGNRTIQDADYASSWKESVRRTWQLSTQTQQIIHPYHFIDVVIHLLMCKDVDHMNILRTGSYVHVTNNLECHSYYTSYQQYAVDMSSTQQAQSCSLFNNAVLEHMRRRDVIHCTKGCKLLPGVAFGEWGT
jgi:hypothetical protein